jgi:hypothetical protein
MRMEVRMRIHAFLCSRAFNPSHLKTRQLVMFYQTGSMMAINLLCLTPESYPATCSVLRSRQFFDRLPCNSGLSNPQARGHLTLYLNILCTEYPI